jgi:predicted DNA repair protein MutK
MASSLLLLLDDITSVLDDVATMTKVAVKKTAGVLGDDLALNAKQVTGVRPDRELPVVWAVARGSAINKLILIPAALGISWIAPWLILHKLLHSPADEKKHQAAHTEAVASAEGQPVEVERSRINGAIRTDFILSAEIVVITLGVVAEKSLATQLGVLAAIGAAMTVGVYGLVAAIVKLDDLGALLAARNAGLSQGLGRAILVTAPWLMRTLSVVGTAAMFLVGGGIVSHELPVVHHFVEEVRHAIEAQTGEGLLLSVGGLFVEATVGITVGLIVVGFVAAGQAAVRLVRQRPA